MSDDIKKIPQFKGSDYTNRKEKPLFQKWRNLITNPYNNAVFDAAHLAQMVNTNTVSNPRPKEQQDFMTKKANKIKQARDNEASVSLDLGIPGVPTTVRSTIDSEKKRKQLDSRKHIGYQSNTMDIHGKLNPNNPSSKEVLDRITGEIKGGKPIKDPPQKVIQLGMKKDDKK